jgi:hypothetical protein
MAEGSEKRRNIIRDNVRKMISMGATVDEINTYVDFEAIKLPGLTVGELFRKGQMAHPETLPSQQLGSEVNLPLSQLREQEQRTLTVPEEKPGGLANMLAGAGLILGSELVPPAAPLVAANRLRLGAFAREAGKQATGAGVGFTVGDLVEKKARGESLDLENLGETGVSALKAAALAASTAAATRGLGEVLAFFRGGAPDEVAKKGLEFAQKTKFEGRKLPARAAEFAPRSAGGKLDRSTQALSVSGRAFAKQQGQKVAQFLETQLVQLSGRPSIIEPTNIVPAAARLVAQSSGKSAQKFGQGVGKDFENAGIWLDQFFAPENSNLLKQLRDGAPEVFADLKAAWYQRALREAQDKSVKNAPHMLFNGNEFRAWFEGNRKLFRDVFSPEDEAVMDGFSAYLKFASPTAKRAFADANTIAQAVPVATDVSLASGGAFFLGPLGAALPGATEGVLGGLSFALSRPGNPIYKMFTEAVVGQKARAGRVLGQALVEERGLRFADRRPANVRIPGAPLPQRERRPTDPRFVPPTFKGLP